MSVTLLEHEAHVWQVVPESIRDSAVLADLRTLLSDGERRQCDRFQFPEDGHRYLISHAMLRHVLAGYTGLDPTDLRFSRAAHGRPEVDNREAQGIRFNLTHTTGLAACIVTRSNDCGIDAEKLDSRHRMTDIAQRMFSAEEHRQLEQLNGAELGEAFYSRWVLREAFVKAKGIGISYPTRKLHFDIQDDNTIRVRFDPDIDEGECYWQFRLLRPTEEHITAIALCTDGLAEFRIVEHVFQG
jgi:4'-phosphopantetheinyl transferase